MKAGSCEDDLQGQRSVELMVGEKLSEKSNPDDHVEDVDGCDEEVPSCELAGGGFDVG
ncbi:hypothetical protein A2U01_0095136, partial [Trifolium medium]|nr:hypothetical protein [Trifolium medium]